MGRPTVMDSEIKEIICRRITDGESIRQIAASEDMPAASTIYLCAATDKDFSEQYARAREAQLVRWEDEIVEISDDGSNDWIERETKSGALITVPDHDHIA